MSAIKNYLMDLTYKVMEAGHEIDPYEKEWNSEEAFEETWDSLTTFNRPYGSLQSLICYFHFCVEDIDRADLPNLYPTTAELLPELNRLYEGYADRQYRNNIFAIKPEYFDEWGSEADEDTRLPYEEVKRLAKDWNVPLAVLISDQLTIIS